MKKKNKHIMKVARTGKAYVSRPAYIKPRDLQSIEDTPDDECKEMLDMRCQFNLDRTGHPFHHMAADGTVVTPDSIISYLLSRIPVDDQEYVTNMWHQHIKPDHMKAVPVDEHWYDKHPVTTEDLDGTSGRFK